MKKLSCTGHIHPVFALLLVTSLALPLGFYAFSLYLIPTLPDLSVLKKAPVEMPLQVYSSDGKLIGEFGEKLSHPVTYQEIPLHQIHAFLAAEDSSFFSHSGISFKGLGRALTESVQGGGAQTGGSTITMQVAKNFFLTPERTLKRKLTEIFLARKIEQNLSKQEILTLYVNKIFLGQHAYGIAAAAQVYYSKPLKDLSIAQMAMIAGLPKAPSKYNPVVNPTRALERRNWIIGRMQQLGFITAAEYQQAVKEPIGLKLFQRQLDVDAPYVAEMVRAEMVEKFGPNVLNSGWQVISTVDSRRQAMAERAVRSGLEDYDQRHGWRGAEAHDKPLADFQEFGNMWPAQVSKVGTTSFEALLQDGRTITVNWKGMAWAKKYINANSTGNYPSKAAQLVALKDIVRVRPDAKDPKVWKLVQIPAVQGQLIALDPESGAIQAVMGGFDYRQSRFNRSIQGWRQPGSTIKPFIYSLALEKGFTPYSVVQDAPLQVGKWRPQNSDGRFMGAITLRRALYLSRNLVSIRLLQSVGIGHAREYLTHFGFVETELPKNLTLALGTAQALPVQIATGYAAFANGGYRVQPYFISSVKSFTGETLFTANPARVCRQCVTPTLDDLNDSDSPDGQPLIVPTESSNDGASTSDEIAAAENTIPVAQQPPAHPAERIMKPRAAYDMANILRDVVQRGTARDALKLGRSDIGGKTGTTNDAKDAWFSGFNPHLVAVAWVGFDRPSTLGRREYGGVAALPIWTHFMGEALADIPEGWITAQGGLEVGKLTPEQLARKAALDEAQSKAEAAAKAPPLPVVISRPRPSPPVVKPPTAMSPPATAPSRLSTKSMPL